MNKKLSALRRGFVASQVSETLSNYKLVDEPLAMPSQYFRRRPSSFDGHYSDDCEFWRSVLDSTKTRRFRIASAAVSEWVARVPGLFWQKRSRILRNIKPSDTEKRVGRFVTLTPLAKSRNVSGGIGTMRLPPSETGYRLVTVTTTLNASAGVPALIAPEAWDCHHLGEGKIISGVAHWQPMPLTWSRLFPAIKGITRACLLIQKPEEIQIVSTHRTPIEVHPFSIMEYTQQNRTQTQLHDFVYASAQTGRRYFRQNLERFFEEYRKAKSRNGTYLTGADSVDPMWESVFASPEEMRQDGGAVLHVIEERIADSMNGHNATEELLTLLSIKDSNDLKRLSTGIELPPNRWSKNSRLGDEAISFVDAVKRADKIPALLYALQLEDLA